MDVLHLALKQNKDKKHIFELVRGLVMFGINILWGMFQNQRWERHSVKVMKISHF